MSKEELQPDAALDAYLKAHPEIKPGGAPGLVEYLAQERKNRVEKRMNGMIVKTANGEIEIQQPTGMPDETMTVFITPEQVPVLIEWLQQAARELEAKG